MYSKITINHEHKDQLKNPMDQDLIIYHPSRVTQDPPRVYHSPTPKRHFLEYDILKKLKKITQRDGLQKNIFNLGTKRQSLCRTQINTWNNVFFHLNWYTLNSRMMSYLWCLWEGSITTKILDHFLNILQKVSLVYNSL